MVDTSTSSQPTFKLPLCIHLTSLFHKSTSLHIPNELLTSLTTFLKTVSIYYNIYSDINEEDIEIEEEDDDNDRRRSINLSYRKILLHYIDPHHLYFEPYGQIPTCKNKTIHIGDDLDDYLNNHHFIYLRPFQMKSDENDIYLPIPNLTSPTSSSIDKKNTQSSSNEINLQALAKELIFIYQQYEKDEKKNIGDILEQRKKKVLSSITCTFSGVIPIEQEVTQHRIWQLANHYGAKLSYDLTGKVTHLIATMTGTTKVNKASHYSKIHIVTLSWLLDSISRWETQDEYLYPLISSVPPSTVVTPVSTPFGNDDDLEDDVDVDDLNKDVLVKGEKGNEKKKIDQKEDEEIENEEKNKQDNHSIPSLILNETLNDSNDELISLQPNEIHEIDEIDWDEADKEVNDYIYESGTDDYISSGPDSPLPESNRKRKPGLLSNSRKKNKPLHTWSLRQSKLTERGPSKLSTTTLFHSFDNRHHHNNNNHIDQISNSSLSSEEDDDEDEDDDTSFLNILAGELDNEIE